MKVTKAQTISKTKKPKNRGHRVVMAEVIKENLVQRKNRDYLVNLLRMKKSNNNKKVMKIKKM